MSNRVRLCAKCKQPIGHHRAEYLPATRLCVACAAQVEAKYAGEFWIVVHESKIGRKGGLKMTSVEYEVETERNPRDSLRFDDEDEV